MSTPADSRAAAKAVIATADALVNASKALVDKAHDQMVATPPAVTLEQYRVLVSQHAVVIGNAATVRQTVALELGADIQQHIAALQQATTTLNNQIAALGAVSNVIERAAKVLVAAGAVATLVAAPSVATVGVVLAAVSEIVN